MQKRDVIGYNINREMYNDIGLQVRHEMILLIEAQSTFSVNIVLRILLYLAEDYKEYAEEQKFNLYGREAVTIPRPELYVVYARDREDVPEALLLSTLYSGAGDAGVHMQVLLGTRNGDIVDQYVRFCKIADEERKQCGGWDEASEETIRLLCAPYLWDGYGQYIDVSQRTGRFLYNLHPGCGCSSRTAGREITSPSSVAFKSLMSCMFAPETTMDSGSPLFHWLKRCILSPFFPWSVGLRPADSCASGALIIQPSTLCHS